MSEVGMRKSENLEVESGNAEVGTWKWEPGSGKSECGSRKWEGEKTKVRRCEGVKVGVRNKKQAHGTLKKDDVDKTT